VILIALFVVSATMARVESQVIRIGLGSCAHQDSSQRIWQTVLNWGPDLFLHLGDAVYADTRDSVEMREAYQKASRNTSFQAVRERVPFLSTWDDHDYGWNDAGASYPMRKVSERLFFDFWDEPPSSERLARPGVYGSRVITNAGRIVRMILLDTRFFRSEWTPDSSSRRRYRPDPDPSKSMLGEAQWTWLEQELGKPADVTLIASSIQFVNDEHGWECWGNFPAERERFIRLIQSTGAQGVVFVSGDRHFTELSCERGGPYSLYDFTSSGLTQVASRGHTVPNSKRIGSAVSVQNFGGITVDFDSGFLTFEAFDVAGTLRFDHRVSLDSLTFSETK
jgi:alkaline phosphatase D